MQKEERASLPLHFSNLPCLFASVTFTTGRLAHAHVHLVLGEDTEKKRPDEYTASRGDLLIGGSVSPSVAELEPNPETVKIPCDGPHQQLLEWEDELHEEGKRPRPPPTVHTPWSHLSQS